MISPFPFSIAIILTIFLFLSPFLTSSETSIFYILNIRETGFWNLLKFGMQMMLILVLGHTSAQFFF
ncbi:MAG: TIGR00366 family protein [Chlorobi bacterium]|nr:TIGR00366 family protein [Chlorobiota bacterium]